MLSSFLLQSWRTLCSLHPAERYAHLPSTRRRSTSASAGPRRLPVIYCKVSRLIIDCAQLA